MSDRGRFSRGVGVFLEILRKYRGVPVRVSGRVDRVYDDCHRGGPGCSGSRRTSNYVSTIGVGARARGLPWGTSQNRAPPSSFGCDGRYSYTVYDTYIFINRAQRCFRISSCRDGRYSDGPVFIFSVAAVHPPIVTAAACDA